MNPTNTVAQEEKHDYGEPRCAGCGGILLVFATDYVTSSRCIGCGRSQVIGWVSCQLGTLGVPSGSGAGWGRAR